MAFVLTGDDLIEIAQQVIKAGRLVNWIDATKGRPQPMQIPLTKQGDRYDLILIHSR
jgi:hypothetical protein